MSLIKGGQRVHTYPGKSVQATQGLDCPAEPREPDEGRILCVMKAGHRWAMAAEYDAIICEHCGLTYVGGPTVVVKTETL